MPVLKEVASKWQPLFFARLVTHVLEKINIPKTISLKINYLKAHFRLQEYFTYPIFKSRTTTNP